MISDICAPLSNLDYETSGLTLIMMMEMVGITVFVVYPTSFYTGARVWGARKQ